MKPRVIAMRVREVLEKEGKKHEAASKSNESKRGIRERNQGT